MFGDKTVGGKVQVKNERTDARTVQNSKPRNVIVVERVLHQHPWRIAKQEMQQMPKSWPLCEMRQVIVTILFVHERGNSGTLRAA